jgi:protein SCO1/2
MKIVRLKPGRSRWWTFTASSLFLVGLFVAGLRLGMGVFASPGQVGAAAGAENQPSGGAAVNPPVQVRDFALTNQAGAPMSLRDLRGRMVVLFFGYTHCPDVCPATLADLTQVKKLLGTAADRVSFVFVTIDSQRDTPAVVKDFLNQFDPDFIGLTGDPAALSSMAADYGAYFSIPAGQHKGDSGKDHQEEDIDANNYFVRHTSPSYVIDQQGFLRRVYFNGTPAEVIADGVRQILQQG